MFTKILVANRGEIAIRAFRAAHELGIATVAVYAYEDRSSSHRLKADEAYQIGTVGRPVRAYLSIKDIIDAALRSGADAIYPGYGFLSENAELAAACADNGIAFIGPSADVLELTGNKSRAIAAARDAGLPVLTSTQPSAAIADLMTAGESMPMPVFVKAVAGGGGRGMRRVEDLATLAESIAAASREADAAFGDARVFLEQAVVNPRHIEVQIIGDQHGAITHLYERDCSLQRRHQKIIEIAPAPDLSPALRDEICAYAVSFAEQIGYSGAGTVEFLVDQHERPFFIEMNPRIQVEHTVTEEITDVDLVQAQILVAAGESLQSLGLQQKDISIRGTALQCRVTTEDPANDFRPGTGKISTFRAPGGAGVRLDGETHPGAEITGFFDSMLVKVTCRARNFPAAVARAQRAVAELRIRGVATNVPFLQAVLNDSDFQTGRITTAFIEEHPALLTTQQSTDRTSRILDYLADVTVNKPYGERSAAVYPHEKLPQIDLDATPPPGSRQLLQKLGPAGFAAALKKQTSLAVTDTTFRDAHQSLLATRVRTSGLLGVAGHVARLTPQLLSVEAWGGATYDVALRFLHEDPWYRLDALRQAIPNICLQMLLRGRNTVGYTPYPTEVTDTFVSEAARSGIDIFRIFDALNNVDQMRPAIDAVLNTRTAVAEVAISYTGNLADPSENLYTLDYYLRLAEEIVEAGAHIIAIKDMAGLLRPAAARILVTALKQNFDLPIHVHTHDTPGGQLATYMAAWEAGADAVDGASAALAGGTSQPALSAIVAAAAHTSHDTGIDLNNVCDLEPYWESLRKVYAPFESGLPAPTGRVYTHEIPGGQLSNLRQQATSLGLQNQFERVEQRYADADRILGRLIKVTPSSKVVGDLALTLVGANADPDEFETQPGKFDIPDSVIGFLQGELGTPAAGWPEPFRTKALEGRDAAISERKLTPADRDGLRADHTTRRRTLDRLLFPGPSREFETHRQKYGDTALLSANQFFYGLRPNEEHHVELQPGVVVLIELEAISEPDEHGVRTVMCRVNGQLRPVTVLDRSISPARAAAEQADSANPSHIAAPFSGAVSVAVKEGDEISAGSVVATIEAMKLEAAITSPRAGRVDRLAINSHEQVRGGDLILVVGEPTTATSPA